MFLVNFLVASLFCISAENPYYDKARVDIKKVNARYESLPDISIETNYRVYRDQKNESLLESKTGKFIRYKGNTYTRIDNVEMYALNDKLISVDKESKTVTVGDNKLLDLHPLQTNVDSILNVCSVINFKQINENEIKYELVFAENQSAEFSRLDIYINTSLNAYSKFVLYYNLEINLTGDFYGVQDKPRLEITYRNQKILAADPLIFDERLYVSERSGKLYPASRFYNYKLSDLRNQTRIKIK